MILDIFEPKRKKSLISVLNQLSIEKIASFKDPTFPTLEEAIEYQITFANNSSEEAESWVKSRNFCDIELMMELEKLALVELLEDNYAQVTYRLTSTGKKLIREIKLREILT